MKDPLKDIMELMEREINRIVDPEDSSIAAEIHRIIRANGKRVFIKIVMENSEEHYKVKPKPTSGKMTFTSRTIDIE